MAKRKDPYEELRRLHELRFQQLEDLKEKAFVARLKAVGTKLSPKAIQDFLNSFRGLGIAKGMTVAEARASADALIEFALDHHMFDSHLDVKDVPDDDE